MGCNGSTAAAAGPTASTSNVSSNQKTLLRSNGRSDVKVPKQMQLETAPRESEFTAAAPTPERAPEVVALTTRSLSQLLSTGDRGAESPDNGLGDAAAEHAESKVEAAEALEAAEAAAKVADAAEALASPRKEAFSSWLSRKKAEEEAMAEAEESTLILMLPPLATLAEVPINVKVTGAPNGVVHECTKTLFPQCYGPPEVIPDFSQP